jgi:transcriptional regulator with XRE-family HTH domain
VLQEPGGRVDIDRMAPLRKPSVTSPLAAVRQAKDLSRTGLAHASGVPRRRIVGYERGRARLTHEELSAIAEVLDVTTVEIAPHASVAHLTYGASAEDDLLREYVSMLLELRNLRDVSPSSLRHEDLGELARVLGGSAEAIEARVMELLEVNGTRAAEIVHTILPSLDGSPTPDVR